MKKILVSGKVQGIVLKSEKPINFLGTVDKKLELSATRITIFLKSQSKILFLFFLQVLVVVLEHIQFIQSNQTTLHHLQ